MANGFGEGLGFHVGVGMIGVVMGKGLWLAL